ncbi:hypothetical protein CDAR_268121 [Caerostris darwini]|uniref:RING-type domain-containing protein n=1 Tax=Caerostris darwini TaxID=1538125 RepID=A0AAV4RGG5_9ARAC|nr:hypothetical protein CDAR_268121 [Caerostris darwini]
MSAESIDQQSTASERMDGDATIENKSIDEESSFTKEEAQSLRDKALELVEKLEQVAAYLHEAKETYATEQEQWKNERKEQIEREREMLLECEKLRRQMQSWKELNLVSFPENRPQIIQLPPPENFPFYPVSVSSFAISSDISFTEPAESTANTYDFDTEENYGVVKLGFHTEMHDILLQPQIIQLSPPEEFPFYPVSVSSFAISSDISEIEPAESTADTLDLDTEENEVENVGNVENAAQQNQDHPENIEEDYEVLEYTPVASTVDVQNPNGGVDEEIAREKRKATDPIDDEHASKRRCLTLVECPVCKESLPDLIRSGKVLMAATCGHVFCSNCSMRIWYQHKKRCPKCKTVYKIHKLQPVYL